jgi:hypothetical protein
MTGKNFQALLGQTDTVALIYKIRKSCCRCEPGKEQN